MTSRRFAPRGRSRVAAVLAALSVSAAAAAAPLLLAAAPSNQKQAFRQAAAERYLKYAAAVREQVLTPQSCPFSPASIVMIVGNEPARLAEWVRKRVAYEPYAGVVRGAEGTLAAKAGGDWDRAVLLQALLAEAGHRSKLKVTPRTPQEATAVVDEFLKRPATIASWYAGATGDVSPEVTAQPIPLVQQFGAVAENRRLYAAREAARVRQMVGEALDTASHETPRLIESLGAAAKLGQPFDAWREKLLAGAAERVDVEIATPQGAAVVSAAPEASPLDSARAAQGATLDAPPADRVAKICVRLELTAGEEGKPAKPVKLIERELPLANLFRRPIRLEIVPSDDAAAAKPTATWTPEDWSKFVGGFKNFQAILRVGDEWEGSKVFDTAGQIHTVSPDGRVEGATQIGGAVGKGMGGFGLGGGGDEAEAPKAASRIESLVMVIELALPGDAPQVQQRLICGKDRPGVTPVFTADALVTPAPIGAHATTWLLLDAVTRNAPLTTRLITTGDPRRFEQTEDAARFPVMLYDWHALRLMSAQRLMAADEGLAFLGAPAVVMHTTHVATRAADAKKPAALTVGTRHAIDVVFDRAMLLPRAADKADQAARANATFGVAATVLESGLLRAIDPANGPKGAYSAFEEARAAGAAPVVIAAGGNAASAVKPPALVAWSLARNEAGRALVFPAASGANAWWSVDPATGSSIGRGDGGEGQSAMEYLQITKKNVDNLKCMVGFSNQILGGDPKGETAKQWFLCMVGADNPGSGHGVPGGIEGMIDPDEKLLNIGVGPLADALGGAKDLYDVMNSDDPILYTGR